MRTKSALLTFGLLLTLGTAQATPGTDFTKALLASDEVTMARQLGLNSLTLRHGVVTATMTPGLRAQSTMTVQNVQQNLVKLGMPKAAAGRITAMTTVQVKYSAEQVAQWAGVVVDTFKDKLSNYTVNADLLNGKVAINIASDAHDDVTRLLRGKVPADAIRLGRAPAYQGLSSNGDTSNAQYIQGRVRPFGGGARIVSSNMECSAGWFGTKNGQTYLMTAAHCVNPSSSLNFGQPYEDGADTIGKTDNTHRKGVDSIAIQLTNTNYQPDILLADYWSGEILNRAPQKGPASSYGGGQDIGMSGATSYRREWRWFADYNRVTPQFQDVLHFSGFRIYATEQCIVASYEQANRSQHIGAKPQPGDSGGVIANSNGQIFGTISVVGPFDPSLPTNQWEMAYCFAPWEDAYRLTGVYPISQ